MIDITLDVMDSMEILQKNLKRLRRQLRRCEHCWGKSCPILLDFQSQFDQALTEVMAELGITASFNHRQEP